MSKKKQEQKPSLLGFIIIFSIVGAILSHPVVQFTLSASLLLYIFFVFFKFFTKPPKTRDKKLKTHMVVASFLSVAMVSGIISSLGQEEETVSVSSPSSITKTEVEPVVDSHKDLDEQEDIAELEVIEDIADPEVIEHIEEVEDNSEEKVEIENSPEITEPEMETVIESEPVVEETPKTVVKTTVYVGSSDSDKYHYETCRWAEKILGSNRIVFDSIETAQARGYSACGTCKPS